MTREEAMYLLNNLRSVAEGEEDEAIDMAIEALNSVTDSENDTVESKNDVIKNLDDTISRQDAIAVVGKYKEEHGYAYYDCACDIENDLKQLPSASVGTEISLPKWIPCSERLPKEYAQYLVNFESGHCYVYWLEDSDWARGMAEKEGIIAWMPLPKPYTQGSEAEE